MKLRKRTNFAVIAVQKLNLKSPVKKELPRMLWSQPIPDTSRLSGVGIEKFLAPGEYIVYTTPGPIWYANSQRTVYVTNRRLLFYKREGRLLGLIKQDRLDEIDLRMIRRCVLKETGLITKKIHLELDEMKLEGQRSELLNLYKAIQSTRVAL